MPSLLIAFPAHYTLNQIFTETITILLQNPQARETFLSVVSIHSLLKSISSKLGLEFEFKTLNFAL